jgi:predicted nuclease of predicted toxin-antitoxin system
VKILFDENLDQELLGFFPDHDVSHVNGLGWQGTTNGQLLAKAQEAAFDLFITADKNMPYQQSMKGRPFSLIVLDIHPNVLMNQSACVAAIEKKIKEAKVGQIYLVDGPHSKRRRE